MMKKNYRRCRWNRKSALAKSSRNARIPNAGQAMVASGRDNTSTSWAAIFEGRTWCPLTPSFSLSRMTMLAARAD